VIQITLTMETKTKDNVFVTIPISVQNRVRPEKVFDAYYKAGGSVAQIKSYVEQVILGHVPGMTLDEVSPASPVSRRQSSRAGCRHGRVWL
jgi:regulator of protease activity HflC (stomatin/prohibitin superfamily)